MYKYSIYIQYDDKEGIYIARVPELPGCMSDGKTPLEAIANTQEVIRVWIESALEDGETIPEPMLYGEGITA